MITCEGADEVACICNDIQSEISGTEMAYWILETADTCVKFEGKSIVFKETLRWCVR